VKHQTMLYYFVWYNALITRDINFDFASSNS